MTVRCPQGAPWSSCLRGRGSETTPVRDWWLAVPALGHTVVAGSRRVICIASPAAVRCASPATKSTPGKAASSSGTPAPRSPWSPNPSPPTTSIRRSPSSWIWNVASELFPDAVEIVDLWHAKQHVWDVGPGGPRRRDGAVRRVVGEDLRGAVGGPPRRRAGGAAEARGLRRGAALRRLRRGQPLADALPGVRAAGLPVGSGVVESSCDAVAGRLKARRNALDRRARREPDAGAALPVAGRPPRRVLQGVRKTAAHGARSLSQHRREQICRTPPTHLVVAA